MAKIASLILAVAIWFLIKDLLESQRRAGKSPEQEPPTILGPAINPDLQGGSTADDEEDDKEEKPTVH